MRHLILFTFSCLQLLSCSESNNKQKDLELKERELALKEKELDLRHKAPTNLKTNPQSKTSEISYKSYSPCSFSVNLPSDFKLKSMYSDSSPDYCDYSVKMSDGFEIIQINSLLNSRFEFSSIKELYQAALKNSELEIIIISKRAIGL